MQNWQQMVGKWVRRTFGDNSQNDTRERSLRFIEEAVELVQVTGLSQSEVFQIIDKVYVKPKGELRQELGGVMVTLLALSDNLKSVDLHDCLVTEWKRVNSPEAQAKLQASQERKLEAGL